MSTLVYSIAESLKSEAASYWEEMKDKVQVMNNFA